jgi:hypothetical protein
MPAAGQEGGADAEALRKSISRSSITGRRRRDKLVARKQVGPDRLVRAIVANLLGVNHGRDTEPHAMAPRLASQQDKGLPLKVHHLLGRYGSSYRVASSARAYARDALHRTWDTTATVQPMDSVRSRA